MTKTTGFAPYRVIQVADLIPYARNARTHSDGQVGQIAASIREFGWTNPVLVDEHNTLIAGHGRLLAARKLGMAAVPAIVLAGLSDAQRRALVIADNKLALNAGWDEEMLRLELADLRDLGFDLDLTGFGEEELGRLMFEPVDGLTDPDEVPETPAAPVSQAGDLWLLGPHRLKCGDATIPADGVDLMRGELADIVFTDPPWNVAYGAVKAGNPMGYKPRTILNDDMAPDQWRAFVAGFCAAFRSLTKPGALAYVVMSAQEWPSVDQALREAGFHWSSSIIWVKDQLVLSRKDYHTQYEPVWYGWNDAGPRLMHVPDRKQSDVWSIARPRVSELHPTTKPVELIERALLNSSVRGAVVLDLFGGSGSTLIACEREGRVARLMELDPRYCDVIVTRWQAFSGQTAVLAATGEPYATVAVQRVQEAMDGAPV